MPTNPFFSGLQGEAAAIKRRFREKWQREMYIALLSAQMEGKNEAFVGTVPTNTDVEATAWWELLPHEANYPTIRLMRWLTGAMGIPQRAFVKQRPRGVPVSDNMQVVLDFRRVP